MKTLAELKRDANTGRMSLKLTERYNQTEKDFPERLRGIRKVKKSNSIGLILINADGKESALRIKRAALMEYDGENLIVYEAGEREPNEQEKRILEDWEKVREQYEKENPYSEIYWKKKSYFENCPCPYMSGFNSYKGKRYQYNGKVLDSSIKGYPILKYKVYMD